MSSAPLPATRWPGANTSVQIFSTCPPSGRLEHKDYIRQIIDVARWSEEAGCRGILIYTDNSLVDPWPVAQLIAEHTESLCPLVAVQPVYLHPYTTAKLISTFSYLFNRRVYLNMVAGGFKNDLAALGDVTPHDLRYERLVEYMTVVRKLLAGGEPVTLAGAFYGVHNLRLTPPLPPELFPGIFVSGSSDAGLAAAERMQATAIRYPKPVAAYEAAPARVPIGSGARVGIICRTDEAEAWRVAHARFPVERKGQLTHQLAMKVSDSVWHKQLSDTGEAAAGENNPYWLVPFQNYKTFCPYLVGSYKTVATELARYMVAGYRTFILDIPPSAEELRHTNIVFRQAVEEVRNGVVTARIHSSAS